MEAPGTIAEENSEPCCRNIPTVQCAWGPRGVYRENNPAKDELILESYKHHKEEIHHASQRTQQARGCAPQEPRWWGGQRAESNLKDGGFEIIKCQEVF